MSTNIEQNVVKMEFDNKAFERNVSQSMSTLGKLKKALKLDGVGDSLDNVSKKASKVNLAPLQNGVEQVKLKFSAMQVAAVTALTNVVNKAVSAGEQIIKSLTLDPVMDGFNEYELKMNSVQTMMNGSGESLSVVNSYLEELNRYADKTIYSFSDMTQNIGKFTNAGVKLKDAVKAIQGISNEAAVSGANANEASHAMYNFAQALSAGAVQLIDWKSIENANMATVEFKNQLIETAEAVGTLKKAQDGYEVLTKNKRGETMGDAISATKNFNDSLQYQWMTTDVLIKTLAKYSDETTEIGKKAFESATKVKTLTQLMDTLKEAAGSGWAQSFEIMFGDFNEARDMFTQVSDEIGGLIGDQANTRNKLLIQTFSSGWKQFLDEGVTDGSRLEEATKEVAKQHGIAIDGMIEKNGSFEKTLKSGWLSADILREAMQKVADTYSKMSDEEIRETGFSKESIQDFIKLNDQIKDGTFNLDKFIGLMTKKSGRELIIDTITNSYNALKSVIKPVSDGIKETLHGLHGDEIYKVLENVSKFTEGLKATDNESENLKNTAKGVAATFDILWQLFKKGITVISPITSLIRPTIDTLLEFTGKAGIWISDLDKSMKDSEFFKTFGTTYLASLEKAKDSAKAAYDNTKDFLVGIHTFFSTLFSGVGDIVGSLVNSFLELGTTMPILYKAKFFFSNSIKLLKEGFGEMKEIASDFFQDFNLIDFIKNLVSVVSGFGLIKVIRNFVSSTDSVKGAFDKIKEGFDKLPDLFDQVGDAIDSFSKKVAGDYKKNTARILLLYATAFSMLALSLYELSKLNFGQILTGLTGLAGVIGGLAGGVKLLSTVSNSLSPKDIKKLSGLSKTLTGFATAVLMLATAVKTLGSLSWDELAKGLIGVSTLSLTLAACSKIMSANEKVILKGSAAMISFAFAVKILSTSVAPLGQLDLESLAKGLGAIGVLCAEMVVTFKLLANTHGPILKGAIAMQAAATAILILVPAMKAFGSMEWESVAKGLVTVGGALVILCTALHSVSSKVSLKGVTALNMLAAGLNLLIPPIKTFGSMDLEGIGKALLVMGGALAELVTTVKMMGTGSLKGATSLIVIAGALNILRPAIFAFAQMSLSEIVKSLGMLAGVLTELTVAMKFLQSGIAGAAALTLMSVAIGGLSASLLALNLLSAGDSIKVLLTLAGTLATIGISAKLLAGLVPNILAVSGALAAFGAAGIVLGTGLSLMGDGLTKFASGLGKNLKLIIDTILAVFPSIVELIKAFVVGVCEIIIDCAGPIGDAIRALFKMVLDTAGHLTADIVEFFVRLIDDVLKSLADHTPQIADSLCRILVGILQALSFYARPIVDALENIVHVIFGELFNWIRAMSTDELLKLSGAAVLMAGFMVAMAKLKSLIPSAMAGLAEFGVFIGEFMGILAIIGGINAIPGVSWLIEKGGDALESVGVAIGRFIGGIFGGIGQGAASTLPEIADYLSEMMTNLQPFFAGAQNLNMDAFTALEKLSDAIFKLNRSGGGLSWDQMRAYKTAVVDLADGLKTFAQETKDIDVDSVKRASEASQSIVDMLTTLPKQDGMWQWIVGEQDLQGFADVLEPLGNGIKAFSNSVTGINADAVTTAANASVAISDLLQTLPKYNGLKQFREGWQSPVGFANSLDVLGKGISAFSENVTGVDGEAVSSAANAAKVIAELANMMPKINGMDQFFDGTTAMDIFGKQISGFSEGYKTFAENVKDINPDQVTAVSSAAKVMAEFADMAPKFGVFADAMGGSRLDLPAFGKQIAGFSEGYSIFANSVASAPSADVVTQAANAAKVIAEFADMTPKFGLISEVFNGGKVDLPAFGEQIGNFSEYYKTFANNVSECASPDIVTQAANAAKVLAEFADMTPKFGLLADKAGTDKMDLPGFGEQIAGFSEGYSKFAKTVAEAGVTPDVVTQAANAAKVIAEFSKEVPKEGFLADISGQSVDLDSFGTQIENFAPHLKNFADKVTGIDLAVVQNAGVAAQTISAFAKEVPNYSNLDVMNGSGNTLESFGTQIEAFAPKLVSFAEQVRGLNTADIESATAAAKTITAFANEIPKYDYNSFKQWCNGDNTLSSFGEEMVKFGPSLKQFALDVEGLSVDSVQNAANAAKMITAVAQEVPKYGGLEEFLHGNKGLGAFGEAMVTFGKDMVTFSESVKDVDFNQFNTSIDSIKKFTDVAQYVKDIEVSKINDLGAALLDLGGTGADDFIKAFTDAYERAKTTGGEFLTKVIEGIESKKEDAKNRVNNVVQYLVDAVDGYKDKFKTAGNNISVYLSNGISDKSVLTDRSVGVIASNAINKIGTYYNGFRQAGRNMIIGFSNGMGDENGLVMKNASIIANNALYAMKKRLDEHSPSKETYKYGKWFVDGFNNGMEDQTNESIKVADNLSTNVLKNFSDGMDATTANLNLNPAITPWVDTSVLEGDGPHSWCAIDEILEKGGGRIYEPVITPVLNTDRLKDGSDYAFSGGSDGFDYGNFEYLGGSSSGSNPQPFYDSSGNAYPMESQYDQAARIGSSNDLPGQPFDEVDGQPFDEVGQPFETVNNYFTINEASDPVRTANEVSNRIGQTMKRRNKAWE